VLCVDTATVYCSGASCWIDHTVLQRCYAHRHCLQWTGAWWTRARITASVRQCSSCATSDISLSGSPVSCAPKPVSGHIRHRSVSWQLFSHFLSLLCRMNKWSVDALGVTPDIYLRISESHIYFFMPVSQLLTGPKPFSRFQSDLVQ
jgi:hypothetical protein